jgi:hypothetical protein
MDRLHALIGIEHQVAGTSRELRAVVRSLAPSSVGAMLVHCSDEAEQEAAEVFRHAFLRDVLPRLAHGDRAPFLLTNPGARYEWGAIRVADANFSTPESARGFKVMVTKISGHVAVRHGGEAGVTFGVLERYGSEGVACGAVRATIEGSELPFALDLADALRAEGVDRLAALRDDARVDPVHRPLFGALLGARMQARHLVQDIQDHEPCTPTLHVVIHGVTLNKPGAATEIIGGVYEVDCRSRSATGNYQGLGDDPCAYALGMDVGRIRVTDPHIGTSRPARDHRRMAGDRLGTLRLSPAEATAVRTALERGVGTGKRRAVAHAALGPVLAGLAATAPLPTALVLAAEGALAVHRIHKLGHAAGAAAQARHAREGIEALAVHLATLPPERAERILDRLREGLYPVGAAG